MTTNQQINVLIMTILTITSIVIKISIAKHIAAFNTIIYVIISIPSIISQPPPVAIFAQIIRARVIVHAQPAPSIQRR